MDRYRSTLPLCVPPWPRQAIRTWSELHRNQDLDHTIFRSRIETVLDWAKARGHRQGDNPARWRGHLKTLLPKAGLVPRHYPAMSVDEVPDFVAIGSLCKDII
jgi:hypothetical protein